MIEAKFVVKVYYEADDVREVECTYFDKVNMGGDIIAVESFRGNAACSPYFEVECETMATAQKVEKVVNTIIKRAKGGTIL